MCKCILLVVASLLALWMSRTFHAMADDLSNQGSAPMKSIDLPKGVRAPVRSKYLNADPRVVAEVPERKALVEQAVESESCSGTAMYSAIAFLVNAVICLGLWFMPREVANEPIPAA